MISFEKNREIQKLERMGPRAVYGSGLLDLAVEHEKVIALSADLGSSSGLDRFKTTYPDRFFNVGIAEQNLIGVASGIANEGFSVFASSFAPFLTFRASEQIRMNLGYMKIPVNLVGIGSGLSMGFLGNSHYGIEDVAIMRSIPGLTVLSPADPIQLLSLLKSVCVSPRPTYIRLTGAPNSPSIYSFSDEFQIGVSQKIFDGKDVAIISTGSMVPYSVQAAEKLQKTGISPTVFDFHTIKPLDILALSEIANNFEYIISIEEHSKIGGLGGAVAEYYADFRVKPKHLIIGLEDNYGVTADYFYLLEKYGLTGEGLCRKILDFLQNK